MILDNIDDTDQNTKRIHSRAQRGGKNGVPLPGEPRRRPKKKGSFFFSVLDFSKNDPLFGHSRGEKVFL